MNPLTGKYEGVILAAGGGSRIRPLSSDLPKPLLPICNKPIVQYQVEHMISLGIRKIFIVCGQLRETFERCLGDGTSFGVSIEYLLQEKPLGIAHALSRVESAVSGPFMLFLGDIFFKTRDLPYMIDLFEKRNACAILAVKQEPNPEYIKRNYAVSLHESGLVRRVVEKPRYTTNNLKGCGLYLFDLPVFDAVRRTPRTAMRDEYELTSAIQILIDDGYPVYPAEVIEWDMNITFIDDLLLCNMKALDLSGKDKEVSDSAILHPQAEVQRSVVGHGVVIDHPIVIADSVIMPDTHVREARDIRSSLVSSHFDHPLCTEEPA